MNSKVYKERKEYGNKESLGVWRNEHIYILLKRIQLRGHWHLQGSGGDMSKAQWGNYLYKGEKIMYA